jgi:GWxTD domain-containing protein
MRISLQGTGAPGRLAYRAVVVLALALACAGASPQAALPEHHKKWLEEEVVYLVTPIERDVFLKLGTDRERDLFIEAFWKHRDPNPGAAANAFKVEHYRRLGYVERAFGRTSLAPGWKTDRGRIHIILGEPNDIQRFTGGQGVYPSEVWFYQNRPEAGLGPAFSLVFFQERGQGDYKLYSPAKDGPQALLSGYIGDPTDYVSAYKRLRDIMPALADVSLSLIPGEGLAGSGRPTLASDLLLQKLEAVPQNRVREQYARKFLEYKDLVEVEYSANYLESDALVQVVRDASGAYFVHYALEPARLSLESAGGRYAANLKVNGTVSASDGRLVYQFDRAIALNLDAAQVRDAAGMPFDYHDMFPLVPGTYKISILFMNAVSKEFTSLERTVTIPDGIGPRMTAPLLGYKTAPAAAGRTRLKPFQFGPTQVYGQPGRTFVRSDTLFVAFQVSGLSSAQAAGAAVRYVVSRPGAAQPAVERTRALKDYGGGSEIIEAIPLADLPPAHYGLQVRILAGGRELVAASDEFDVTFRTDLVRPWLYSRLFAGLPGAELDRTLGEQYLRVGRPGDALAAFEKSLALDPAQPEIRKKVEALKNRN